MKSKIKGLRVNGLTEKVDTGTSLKRRRLTKRGREE